MGPTGRSAGSAQPVHAIFTGSPRISRIRFAVFLESHPVAQIHVLAVHSNWLHADTPWLSAAVAASEP